MSNITIGRPRKPATLIIGGPPFADLLPPEIALEAKARSQRAGLIAVIVVLAIIVIGGYVGVSFLAQQAEDELVAAQAQTAALLAEQSKYSEVRTAQAKVSGITSDQKFATTTEIDWTAYLNLAGDALPSGASITGVDVLTSTPVLPIAAPSSPLEYARIAELKLTAVTADVPNIVEWISALETLPGYADSTPTSILKEENGYTLQFTMHINTDALSNRFADEEASK